jgi:hypothetical protein
MKVWLITIKGDDERQRLRVFAKREDAVAELTEIKEDMEKYMRHTYVYIKEVDDLLVVTWCDEGEAITYEAAAMAELTVVEPGDPEKYETTGISDAGWEADPNYIEAMKKNISVF